MTVSMNQLRQLIADEMKNAMGAARFGGVWNPAEQRTDFMGKLFRSMDEQKRESVSTFAGVCAAVASGKGSLDGARAWAEQTKGIPEAVKKALGTSDLTSGGVLIPETVSADVIEALKPMSVVEQLQPTEVSLEDGQLTLPRIDSGSAFAWVGESGDIASSQPVWGGVKLTSKKAASLVPLSNELILRSPGAVDTVVSNDIVGTIAAGVDLAYLTGAGTTHTPQGLATHPGITKFDQSGTTPAAIEGDLYDALQRLMAADVRMLRPGWILAPRTWGGLVTARDGTGGNRLFPEMRDGSLLGHPFKVSSQVPVNLGAGSNESWVLLADFADVLRGFGRRLAIDTSSQATYLSGGSLVSAFSRDETLIRVILETDIGLRHDASVVLIEKVTWSA